MRKVYTLGEIPRPSCHCCSRSVLSRASVLGSENCTRNVKALQCDDRNNGVNEELLAEPVVRGRPLKEAC